MFPKWTAQQGATMEAGILGRFGGAELVSLMGRAGGRLLPLWVGLGLRASLLFSGRGAESARTTAPPPADRSPRGWSPLIL